MTFVWPGSAKSYADPLDSVLYSIQVCIAIRGEAGMTEVLANDTHVSARRAVTRERLMVAASTVFAEHGIPGASVEEIC